MVLLPKPRDFIEDAAPSDASGLAEIHERSFSRPWSTDELSTLLADPPTTQGLLVRSSTVRSKRIAGFILIRSAGGEAEILTLAVNPGDRRRGLGRMLVEEGARRAYRDRAESMFLEVDESNQSAVSLYQSLGFEPVGQRSSYYERSGANPGRALVMRLRLR